MSVTQTKSFSGLYLARYQLLIREISDYFCVMEYHFLMKSKHLNILGRTQGLLHSHSCKDAGHPDHPIFISKLQMLNRLIVVVCGNDAALSFSVVVMVMPGPAWIQPRTTAGCWDLEV